MLTPYTPLGVSDERDDSNLLRYLFFGGILHHRPHRNKPLSISGGRSRNTMRAGGVMAEWNDISTAPRDGTEVELTWIDDNGPNEIWPMKWDPDFRNGLFPDVVGFWVTPDESLSWNERGDGGPTHWRHSYVH